MRIDLSKPLMPNLLAMVEGNPGAIEAITPIIRDYEDGVMALCLLDEMGIYGSNIWIGFKDVCHQDHKLFHDKIMDRSILEAIKKANRGTL